MYYEMHPEEAHDRFDITDEEIEDKADDLIDIWWSDYEYVTDALAELMESDEDAFAAVVKALMQSHDEHVGHVLRNGIEEYMMPRALNEAERLLKIEVYGGGK